MVTAIAFHKLYGKEIRYCSNRKEAKDHGDTGILLGSKIKDGDKVVTHVGIDFQTADQNALVNSGMVSGDYKGNMADGRLSFSATIREFEKTGMTSTVTPVYGTAK